MNTKIISAFPCCGKTYVYENQKEVFTDFKTKNGRYPVILDSDSSKYSWIISNEGMEKERNPAFPNNYIEYIKNNIGKVDYIFVSSHEEVREALAKAGINFTIVVPNKSLLNEWMIRAINRDDEESFVNMLIDNWDKWLNKINEESNTYAKKIELKRFEFLADVLEKC